MKTIANALRRAVLLFQIRAVQITVDGMSECLECVRDPYLTNRILIAQINARHELRRLRQEYTALRSTRRRNGWGLA